MNAMSIVFIFVKSTLTENNEQEKKFSETPEANQPPGLGKSF